MSLARLKPFYVSLAIRNTYLRGYTGSATENANVQGQEANQYIIATITQDYNTPLCEKASDYLCAVERMELDMHAIAFYNTVDEGTENIVLRSRVNPALTTYVTMLESDQAYSMPDLLDKLTKKQYTNPNTGNPVTITFDLTKEGYARMLVTGINANFNYLQVEFPPRLNMILGIAISRQLFSIDTNNLQTIATSTYPRVGLGDYLDHIMIRTNLPTYSDSIGNERVALLTDFGIPFLYQSTMTYTGNGLGQNSWTMPVRDKLLYYPSERRYLELNGDFPINNIYVQALYRTCYGTYKPVVLPYGGSFELKLGFYLRQ